MASPAGQYHPWRMVISFLAITVGLFALVFFTPGSNAPKLGIDLEGGTRVTLTARTLDGSTPPSDSMKQARDIMEQRVNGSGVAGATVQVDGSRQLVITVPGQEALEGLTRSAQLNIRPVVTQWLNPAALEGMGGGEVPPGDVPDDDAEAPSDAPQTPTDAEAPSDAQTPTTADTPTSVPADDAEGVRSAGVALLPQQTSETPDSDDATATDDDATATDDDATAADDDAPPLSAFPPNSDPDAPVQPAGDDEAAFAEWESVVRSYAAQQGSGPTCEQIKYYQGLDDAAKPIIACDEAGLYVYLLEPTLIPGTEVVSAASNFDGQSGNGWVINVEFNGSGPDNGATVWGNYTANHVGTQTAFTLDGQVLSAPSINSPIPGGKTMVSGSFDEASSKALADSLKYGALPLAFDRSESQQVSAELGTQYLKAGLIAGGIGLLLVVVYCLIYYRLLGIITILSLVLSGALVYAVMVLLGRWIGLSLDMAGIAGLIIAIGITADSFVVYFERIKDEVREGRTFRSSVPRGWARAKKTILSADAVSILSAAILYFLAVGDVKGFAFTLGLSTVLDLFVVFMVTHPLVALLSKKDIFSHPFWSGLGSVAKAGREHRAAAAQLQVTEA